MTVGCPTCGQETPEGFPRCANCGAELADGKTSPREERKVVTVLFCDLVGFTASSEYSDPENVHARLAVCPREVVDALQRCKASKGAVGTEAIVEVERRG
jgi:class 3 adenylate cyclase